MIIIKTNQKIKLIFFWTLVLMFFATSAVLIFYSFGYTFSLQKKMFIHAGTITIKTNPQDVNVELNNVNVSKKTNRINNSFNISGVYPGEYLLKISAPGFKSWSKKISVHSGISTEFWNVLLTRDEYEQTSYDPSGIKNFFISPTKNLIATVFEGNEGLEIKILNSKDNTNESSFVFPEFTFTDNKDENIEWSPQSQKIIIPTKKGVEKNYIVADIDTNEIINLNNLINIKQISSVRWDPENKNILYLMSEKNLYKIDITDAQQYKIIAQQIASYDISQKYVYFMQFPSGIIFQTDRDGTQKPVQITTSSLPEIDPSDSYKLVVYDEQRLTVKSTNGKFFVFNKSELGTFFKEISNDTVGSQFSNDGKKLLFWSNREVSIFFTRDWQTQPKREENEIFSIIRFSEAIKNIHWSDDYEHVIFSAGNKIKIAEIDQRGNKNIFDITSLKTTDSKIVDNFSERKLYFTNLDDQNNPILQSILFPEKNSLLRF